MDYLYDGTYSGLLCCIYAHYYVERAEGIFREDEYQTNLFENIYRVKTDETKAQKVYEAIEEKLGEFTLRRSYLSYLSCFPDREMRLLRYLVFGFQKGRGFNRLHGDPNVFGVQEMEKRIYAERHRYLGILRFSAIAADRSQAGTSATAETFDEAIASAGAAVSGGTAAAAPEESPQILYAAIQPDNDLLELLVEHFLNRYQREPFVIHDVGRQKAVFAGDGKWYVAPLSKGVTTKLAQGEEYYRAMWKRYFDSIAIVQRSNSRCQKNFMPMKYWNHLTEKQL